MDYSKGKWKAGYNPCVTGPTTPVGTPFCGGEDWPYRTINVGKETIAVVPAQSDSRWAGRPGNPVVGSAEANARLIAAAPELYEALKAFLAIEYPPDMADWIGEAFPEAHEWAQEAIAKAEG